MDIGKQGSLDKDSFCTATKFPGSKENPGVSTTVGTRDKVCSQDCGVRHGWVPSGEQP